VKRRLGMIGVRRMARNNKRERLEELRREIIEEFFIKGFQGK